MSIPSMSKGIESARAANRLHGLPATPRMDWIDRIMLAFVIACVMVALWIFGGVIARAQGVPPQTWFKVTMETSSGITMPSGMAYRFGIAACPQGTFVNGAPLQTATDEFAQAIANGGPISPVSMAGGDPFPFPDPCPNTVKELDMLETGVAQQIMFAGVAMTVPADASLNAACQVLPTTGNANPTLPVPQPVCSMYPGMLSVAPDGDMLKDAQLSEPVFLQYCEGTACATPFMLMRLPISIGPGSAALGGTPGISPGALYAMSGGQYPNTLIYLDTSLASHSVTLPGIPGAAIMGVKRPRSLLSRIFHFGKK